MDPAVEGVIGSREIRDWCGSAGIELFLMLEWCEVVMKVEAEKKQKND